MPRSFTHVTVGLATAMAAGLIATGRPESASVISHDGELC